MSNLTGLPGPWLQPSEYGRTEVGQFATVPYEDVDPNKINALAAQFDRLGYRYRVTHNFGKHRLEVYLSYNNNDVETPVDLWEYNDRGVSKDVLQAATNTGITGTLSAANISVIRNALNGTFPTNAPKDSTGTQTLDASANSFADGNPAKALIIYTLMKSGMQDYIVQSPILTHTQSVSYIYPITLSLTNVGKLISTTTLLMLETPPSWAVFGLPNTAPPTFADGKNFVFAWYKLGPKINQIANQKVQIVQEFQYGLWPTAVLDTPL